MLLFATLFSIILLGCTDTTEDTGTTPLVCGSETPSPFPVGTSSWSALTETTLYNHCENDAGNGVHIHLGETNILDFVDDGDCLRTTANEAFPVDMEGLHDGTDFELEGRFFEDFGLCELQVDGTFAGTMTDADRFDYTFHLKVTDLNTDCAIAVGETEAHTYKQLPCELSWTGFATRQD
jgi:hypothetical protein